MLELVEVIAMMTISSQQWSENQNQDHATKHSSQKRRSNGPLGRSHWRNLNIQIQIYYLNPLRWRRAGTSSENKRILSFAHGRSDVVFVHGHCEGTNIDLTVDVRILNHGVSSWRYHGAAPTSSASKPSIVVIWALCYYVLVYMWAECEE